MVSSAIFESFLFYAAADSPDLGRRGASEFYRVLSPQRNPIQAPVYAITIHKSRVEISGGSDSAFDAALPDAASQPDLHLAPGGKRMAVLVVEQLKA